MNLFFRYSTVVDLDIINDTLKEEVCPEPKAPIIEVPLGFLFVVTAPAML